MLGFKLIKNVASGAVHIFSVVVVASLIFCWSRSAFSDEPTAAPAEQPHLQLAPINFTHSAGGNFGYIFQNTTLGSIKTTQQSAGVDVFARFDVSSYVWQPWIAQVASNLTFNVDSVKTKNNTTPTYTIVDTFIIGDASLDLLKYSRFPFDAHIFRDDSRFTASYSGTDLTTQRTGYSLSQSYTTMDYRLRADAGFTSQKFSELNLNPSYSDIFNFSLSNQVTQHQSISISAIANSQDQPTQGRSSLYDTLMATHAYQPNNHFSMASIVNLFKMNSLTQGSSPTNQNDAHSQQFDCFANLRPERSPLTMTSSVRISRTDSSNNGIPVPTLEQSNFNLGANYLFSPLVRMYGSVNVGDSLGIQTVTTNAALTAATAYRAKTDFDGYHYNGSIGGSVGFNNQTSTDSTNPTVTQTGQNLGLYLSQGLDKTTQSGADILSKNLNQTISTGINSSGSSLSNLTTSGALSLRHAEGKETTLLRLSATDSRRLGGTQNLFQMINLQASRSEAMTRNETLLGSLSVQATHQVYGIQNIPSTITPNTITPSASMEYHNLRAFKVLRLTFESILRITDSNIAPTQYPGYQDHATRSWDNNFAYKIGRLNLQLKTRISEINNVPQSWILFAVSRPF